MNVFDQIVLILLSIFSVRDLLAKNIDIPKNKKWSWLFYNNKEINQVPSCYQLSKIKDNSMPISIKSDITTQLLIVLGEHTKYFENTVYCDRDKRIPIHYLVSTLEASYVKSDLNVLVDIAEKMISELSVPQPIDFIISLKGGNVLLVDKLINNHKVDIKHLTYNRNLFYQSFGVNTSNQNDLMVSRSLQFENFDELIRLSELSDHYLKGIILDCSYSSGKGIIACVEDFNNAIETSKIKVNPITQVRTIYSHVGEDIQKELDKHNCCIKYLFSLDEDVRKKLYTDIKKEPNIEKKVENAKNILQLIKSKKSSTHPWLFNCFIARGLL